MVATTNKVASIPPEFMRKGRFDEIFYVALPSAEERESIFDIHIKKRRPEDDISDDDLAELAREAEDFSGADIEGAIKDAIEECFCHHECLTLDALLDAIKNTRPLSKVMAKEIEEMKKLFEERNFAPAS